MYYTRLSTSAGITMRTISNKYSKPAFQHYCTFKGDGLRPFINICNWKYRSKKMALATGLLPACYKFASWLPPSCHKFASGLLPACHKVASGLPPACYKFASGLPTACNKFVCGLLPACHNLRVSCQQPVRKCQRVATSLSDVCEWVASSQSEGPEVLRGLLPACQRFVKGLPPACHKFASECHQPFRSCERVATSLSDVCDKVPTSLSKTVRVSQPACQKFVRGLPLFSKPMISISNICQRVAKETYNNATFFEILNLSTFIYCIYLFICVCVCVCMEAERNTN